MIKHGHNIEYLCQSESGKIDYWKCTECGLAVFYGRSADEDVWFVSHDMNLKNDLYPKIASGLLRDVGCRDSIIKWIIE